MVTTRSRSPKARGKVIVVVEFRPEMAERLTALAEREEMPRSCLVREAVRRLLEERGYAETR